MVGSIFRRDVKAATGVEWERWVVDLQRTVDPAWSHEQIRDHIGEHYIVEEEWAEWLAVLYAEILGRTPIGVTKDAGVQFGVRKTVPMTKEQAWSYMTSPQGLKLWIGSVPEFQIRRGFEFASAEGISGKLTVVEPVRKLRMTWQRQEWDKPSRLQIYWLSAAAGKTTIAIHQEMLDDVYVREMMRRHWDDALAQIERYAEAAR